MITELRNASIDELNRTLRIQHDSKLDVVSGVANIRSVGAVFHIDGVGTPQTVEEALGQKPVGKFRPSDIMQAQIAEKLGIPAQYLRKMAANRPDLYDANVNGWLHGGVSADWTPGSEHQEATGTAYAADRRRFLIRAFQPGAGSDGIGIGRAFLSDRFAMIDYLDPLISFLQTLAEVDPLAEVVSTDLSDRRCVVRVASPAMAVSAPGLLRDYRSPIVPRWTPRGGAPRVGDIVYAGMKWSTSEVGHGAYELVPEIRVLACTNGMTITKDAMRRTHLGAKLAEGVIDWSAETRQANVALVAAMTRDAVKSFMSVDYVEKAIAELEQLAGVELEDPTHTLEVVAKQLAFSEDVAKTVLDHFIKGGQVTAGGVLQAVTSTAQVVTDPNLAFDLEENAVKAMTIAASTR